jgi:cell division protease FtsH
MSTLMLPPPPPPVPAIHEPDREDDREPKTRLKMMFGDRIKVLVLIAVFILLSAAYLHSKVPIMSYWEAVRNQLRAKWWLVGLFGLEVLRQVHYVICEHVGGYNQFFEKHVWGAWNRRMDKVNPWRRYRMNRTFKWVIGLTILGLVLAWKWGTSFWEAIAEAPGRFFDILFVHPVVGLPLFFTLIVTAMYGLFSLVIFFGIFFIGGIETYKPGEIKTRFRDVWGQDPVLGKVRENIDFLEKPAEIEAKGGYVPSGILLWGPPGTGKTLIAEAVAGETGKPYVFVDPSSFVQTFIGVAPMKIKWMYRKLRKLALRNGGVVVFFDEADVLGNRGSAGGGGQFDSRRAAEAAGVHACNGCSYVDDHSLSIVWHGLQPASIDGGDQKPTKRGIIMGGFGMGGGMGALQALLTEMSGLKKPRGFFSRRIRSFLCMKPKPPPKYRILHIMATNRPDVLDQALLRPGRLDRIYKVGYPHVDGRRRTYEGYLDKVRHSLTGPQIDRLAVISPYATGAIIKDIVNEALIIAMRDQRDTITWGDMLKAKHLKTHGIPDDWTYGDLERHQVAIHEASHAVAMYRLQKRSTIDVATIERRGGTGGFVAPMPLEERFTEWRTGYETDVKTFLASLAGERMFFEGDNSAGVGGDLFSATRIITETQAYWGMGPSIASHGVTKAQRGGVDSRPEDGTDRNLFETSFGRQVEARLQDLLTETEQLMEENRRFVLAVAHALETYKTVTGDDIDAIFRGTPGPTLDGWVYHTDEFLLSYEAYHLSTIDAHQRQAKMTQELPVIASRPGHTNGWAPPTPMVPRRAPRKGDDGRGAS